MSTDGRRGTQVLVSARPPYIEHICLNATAPSRPPCSLRVLRTTSVRWVSFSDSPNSNKHRFETSW